MLAPLLIGTNAPFVVYKTVTGEVRQVRGEGLVIDYDWCDSPFGSALIMINKQRLCGLGFSDHGFEQQTLVDMRNRLALADYRRDSSLGDIWGERIFDQREWDKSKPLPITFIGNNFQIKVWKALLKIPFSQTRSYSQIACEVGSPKACRAVGTAVGRNPIAFIAPCHRVIGKSGGIAGYHWGIARKIRMLEWERQYS